MKCTNHSFRRSHAAYTRPDGLTQPTSALLILSMVQIEWDGCRVGWVRASSWPLTWAGGHSRGPGATHGGGQQVLIIR